MTEQQISRRKLAKLIPAVLMLLCIGLCGFWIWYHSQPKVHDLTVELGTETVSVADFATKYAKPERFKFASDPSAVDINRTGTTEITLDYGGSQSTAKLTVVDTVAPKVNFVQHVFCQILEEPDPEVFISSVTDESDTRVYFASDVVLPKDYSDVTVCVVVEDASGNKTKKECVLSWNWLLEDYTLEYGQQMQKEDILMDPARDTSLISQEEIDRINAGGVGVYTLTGQLEGNRDACRVTVVDTQGPVLTVKNVKTAKGMKLSGDAFIESVTDISGVAEVRALSDLNTDEYGKQTVMIEAEDIYGNVTRKEAYFWVATEYIPPMITGAGSPLSVKKGGQLDLMAGVSAADNRDGACEVVCDTGKLDFQTAGTYYITYKAWDNSGNEASVKRKVVVEHDAADTAALAASIAASLGDDPEQLRDYVRSNIRYNHDWGDNDPVWYGFTNKVGNCYVHAMCLKAIFDLKGIENQLIWVTAKSHYWLIVKINGQWKHIDPTPSVLHGRYSLMNDQQRLSTLSGRKWDTSLWPACE